MGSATRDSNWAMKRARCSAARAREADESVSLEVEGRVVAVVHGFVESSSLTVFLVAPALDLVLLLPFMFLS